LGGQLVEQQDADGFTAYLRKHQNTICGRHPISVRDAACFQQARAL
jgi:predicted class III extradiol MEMO1 family dioxygenase